MARVHVEEALLREPNLWTPDKKPVGNVKVDSSHPMANGLIVYIMPTSRDSATEFRNYADHSNPGVANGTAPSAYYVRTGRKGQEALLCHPSGGSNGVDLLQCVKQNTLANTDDITCISIYDALSAVLTATAATYRGVGADSFRMVPTSTTNYRVSYIDSSPAQFNVDVTVPTITTSTVINVAGRLKGSTLSVFYKSANSGIVSNSSSAGNGTFRDDSAGNIFTLVGDQGGTTLHGRIYVSMIWKRALSDADIQSLMLDPYQFLIPA